MSNITFGARSTADDVASSVDLTGRTMLITGSNAGIGFETARALAGRGAHVIVACRNEQTADQTCQRIRATHRAAKLSPLALDLGSFASIRRAAAALTVPALHTLICNAGLYTTRYEQTADGIESTVGVCHFGHFLLFQLLRERLRTAEGARVVFVSSESHRFPSRLDLERFPLTAETFKGLVAYGQAKLCNVLTANELTRRFAAEGIHANSLHPGSLIGTSIFRSSGAARLLSLAVSPFTKSVAQGAATTVYCAVAPALAGVGGRYFADCGQKEMSKGARDGEVASRLWALSEARVATSA